MRGVDLVALDRRSGAAVACGDRCGRSGRVASIGMCARPGAPVRAEEAVVSQSDRTPRADGAGDDGARVDGARPDGPGPDVAPDELRFDAEGRPLDPREIARASLAADRNWSLWVVAGCVLACVALALVVGTPTGALALATFLACCAVVRGVVRGPAPSALVVRNRVIDATALGGLALAIGVLSQIVPTPLP